MKKGLPAWLWRSIIVAIVIVIGFLDWVTGYKLDFSLFYFLPISLGAWLLGFGASSILAVVCTIVCAGTNLFESCEHLSYFDYLWNILIRFFSFLVMGWSMYRIRYLLDYEREIAVALRRALSDFIGEDTKSGAGDIQ